MSAAGGARDAAAAQRARAEHDAAKAEVEAREDSFRSALELGRAMVQTGHRAAQEVEEKCEALLAERQRLHAAWQARQVALDQLIDLHFFLRDAKQLHNLCSAQEAALGTEISPTASVEEVDAQLKRHEAFEKLLNTQEEKLVTLNTHGAKLLQQNHVESKLIAEELEKVNERRKKVKSLCARRRAALESALLRAQFVRDAGEVRAWIASKLKKLDAEEGASNVTSLDDKIKKLQKHQAFTAELAANSGRVNDVAELAHKLVEREPQAAAEVKHPLESLQRDWTDLIRRAEERGRGLEEAQDMLEFNNQVQKIDAWIRDKEMMVQANDTGRDYEHCMSLIRKLDDLDSDMRVDDKNMKAISALADKLLQQGPTGNQAIAERRDTCLRKWKALSGALQAYRDDLEAALELHLYNRDVADTASRVAEKSVLLSSSETGRDLNAVEELLRKQDALMTETTAIGDKIKVHQQEGERLKKKYPEKKGAIEPRLQELNAAWAHLLELAKKRSLLLGDGRKVHKFDAELKAIEVWVNDAVKKMHSTEPPNSVAESETLLELHHERKAGIDDRQQSIKALKNEAETKLVSLESAEAPLKVSKLNDLASTLDEAWENRKTHLTQSHQLQLLKEQARQTEDWLAAKEAFLNNDDLGESLADVEALVRKHEDFSKLLEAQLPRVEELERFADEIIQDDHYDRAYIEQRVFAIATRRDKLKESCENREKMLRESRQLQQFLRNLYQEQEWIALKSQFANDQSYKDLSNLQSKIQKHTAFESELTANKGRIDDVVNDGEELIENGHYASETITKSIEELEESWNNLNATARSRRDRLAAAYHARVFLRGADDFCGWIDDTEAQLQSEDHGKDLSSVAALLKRHARLEQQVAARAETATQLSDTAQQLATSEHFMSDDIVDKASQAINRYRQLQEPMQIRRDNLEDALLLQRWERDAEEEARWLGERAAQTKLDDVLHIGEGPAALAKALSLQKKHQALEAELLGREPVIASLTSRASNLIRRGHFASARIEKRSTELQEGIKELQDGAAVRRLRLQDIVEMHQFFTEAKEAEQWLLERRPHLASSDVGMDEDSVQSLQRKLEAQQRELATFDATLNRIDKMKDALSEKTTVDVNEISVKVDEIRQLYEELKLLSAKRQQRLQQSNKYFRFVRECEEVNEWIGDQTAHAASEDYGTDVEHVEILIQAFDNFIAGLSANEGRVEAVAEAGKILVEERTPEADLVEAKVEETRALWEDLKELAHARQEALAGARQVHVFDRTADETVAWIAEKDSTLNSDIGFGGHHDLHAIQALVRKHDAIEADLEAVRQQVDQLNTESERLGTAFPDAREHVAAKLDEVSDSLQGLLTRAADGRAQLRQAEQLEEYFDQYRELLAWTNEVLARVTAPELGADVAAAERLVARHNDILAEIGARKGAFNKFYEKGEALVASGHFLSAEVGERMSALRQRKALLDETWAKRARLYEQHLDAMIFKRDADSLEAWINSRIPQLRDPKLGENIPQVEDLIKKHDDFQKMIDAQNEKFNALNRITLVEQAFREQQNAEAAARKETQERQEAERLEQRRRAERQRIEDQRRREEAPLASALVMPMAPSTPDAPQKSSAPPSPPLQKANSVAHMFGKHDLRKQDANVKRAESMNVTTAVKAPKRTPSFTTRRRTQSFRRLQRGDPADLPPVEIEGYLERKHEAGCGGKRAAVRSWRQYYTVLCGQLLCFFRDEIDFAQAKAAAPPQVILNARCEPAGDYTKRKHVFRLSCADGAEFLFGCTHREAMMEWVAKVSFHAQLPPSQQLTPYHDQENDQSIPTPPQHDSPTAIVRKKLQDNAPSSSSSVNSSPEPERRHRTQAEILQEHRTSIQQQRGPPPPPPTRESAVLPSLPPRQPPPPQPLPQDVMLRRDLEKESGWGRSRFSNGKDINTEFITSQALNTAFGEPTPPTRSEQPSGHVSALVSSWQHRSSQPTDSARSEQTYRQRAETDADLAPYRLDRAGLGNLYRSEQTVYTTYGQEPTTNRNYRQQQSSWGSSDSNTQFYATDYAYNTAAGNNVGLNNNGSTSPSRPASVGSTSHSAHDRHMSESSGESELSATGVSVKERKDKKGVFSGLFSRKKRPNSHM